MFWIKALIAGLIVAGASSLARHNTLMGSILVALPLLSILTLSFLYIETGDTEKISTMAIQIVWAVLPTLLFFVMLKFLLSQNVAFWAAMAASIICMILLFGIYVWGMKKFDITVDL